MGAQQQIAMRLPDDVIELLDQSLDDDFPTRAALIIDLLRKTERRRASQQDLLMFLAIEADREDPKYIEWMRTREFPSSDGDLVRARRRRGNGWMRPIHRARFGSEVRPVLVLTRGGKTIGLASKVTVAGITSTIHGLATELPVGPKNGLDRDCVVDLADIQTINQTDLEDEQLGLLLPHQERALHAAAVVAFDLDL